MIEPATLARLARLLGAEASGLRVRPLPGGISNRSFLLTSGSNQWAARLPMKTGAVKTLDPETEARVLRAAADARLTPEVLACDAGTGALVTRYLVGARSLTAEHVRRNATIDRIATTLRRLHGLPPPAAVRAFRPTQLARIYTRIARSAPRSAISLADETRCWSAEFKHLAEAFEAEFTPAGLCHNDLVAANILDDEQLWLVDFEYAVCADPIVDLAGLAGLNGFGPDHRRRLLNAYYGPGRAPITLTQLNQVVRLVRLMAFFWALAHGGADATDNQRHFAASIAAVLR